MHAVQAAVCSEHSPTTENDMFDYKITRDDNGHSWYCSKDRISFFLELAAEGGYKLSINPTPADELDILRRSV